MRRAHDAKAAASHSDKPLRGYQQEILRLLADGGNFLVVAPTGAGKVGAPCAGLTLLAGGGPAYAACQVPRPPL